MVPEARSQGYKVNMNKSIKKVVERGFWIGHDRCAEVKKMEHLYVPFFKYFLYTVGIQVNYTPPSNPLILTALTKRLS